MTLIARGYVMALAANGLRAIAHDDVPYGVPDYIWEVAVEHKSEFPYEPDRDGGDAWRERSLRIAVLDAAEERYCFSNRLYK